MKPIITTITFMSAAILTTVLLVSCEGESSKHDGHTNTTQKPTLVLNHGKKWQMDEHTRTSFTKMAGGFVDTDIASLNTDGLKQAGSVLREQLSDLIRGCTMTGADHDQLHVYLMNYIPAVDDLKESGQTEDATKVQHYLKIYGDYFE